MRNVFQSPMLTEAALVRDRLSSNGIAGKLVEGQSPYPQTAHSEVWVPDDEYERAARLVRDMYNEPEVTSTWECAECGEKNAASFDLCWQCGTGKSL